MSKYKHIEKALGLTEDQQLAFDKYGGFYCNAPMVPTLEQTLADFAQQALTAEANIEALGKANTTIANLHSKIDELKASLEENSKTIASLTADKNLLTEENTKLNADLENVKSDNSVKADIIEKMKTTITEKETELDELSKQTTSAPLGKPARATEENADSEDKGKHHFYKPGMTAKEARQAFRNRIKYLQTKR